MSGRKRKSLLLRLLGALLMAGVLCFLGLVGYVVIRERGVKGEVTALEKDYDAIIVLGAQVLPSGEPNTQLKWRLDAALKAWNARPAPVIVCGARGKDEPVTEAEAMERYLARNGIPENQIHQDPESFNTDQNLRNAAEILQALPGTEKKVLIVTSDYHVPRSMALAEDLGYEAEGLGAPCKPEYWMKNHAREALAWVKYWLVKYLHIPL